MESSPEASRMRSLQSLWELLPAHVQHLVIESAIHRDVAAVSKLRLVCRFWLDEVAACVASLSLPFEPLGAPLHRKINILAQRFPNVTRLDLSRCQLAMSTLLLAGLVQTLDTCREPETSMQDALPCAVAWSPCNHARQCSPYTTPPFSETCVALHSLQA
jgi:hypothetical protein